MASLLKLPVDITIAIFVILSPEDILALKQTCRVLHALGCLDYVWHQVTIDLPLDLPLNQGVKSLQSSEIQAIIIRALRLERNWCGHPGRPRQLIRIQHDVVVHQMQPLGSEWLLTLTRPRLGFQLSIRSLTDNNCYRIVDCHAVAMSFSAALELEHQGTLVTIEYDGIQTEHLNIYSFSLPRGQGYSCTTRKIHTIPRPTSEGTYSDIQICGNIVAASIARFMDMISPPSYEVFLINITSNVRWSFSTMPLSIERLRFKVLADRVVIVGVQRHADDKLIISSHTIPPLLLVTSDNLSEEPLNLEGASQLIAQYETTVPIHGFEFYISAEPAKALSRNDALPILIFPNFIYQHGTGCILRLPLVPPSKQLQKISSKFKTPAKTSVDVVCLGGTGRRAVWLRRHWETDTFELMRGSFSQDGTVRVRALFPKDMALPFETQSCLSLAFDEATGRIYVGLHTGGLYLLTF